MNLPLGIGTCIVFENGYGDLCAKRSYAVLAIQAEKIILTEIDPKHPRLARYVRQLDRPAAVGLINEGLAKIVPLPIVNAIEKKKIASGVTDLHQNPWIKARLEKLEPLITARLEILSSTDPAKKCNDFARKAGLNVTRARTLFFWLAAYSFDTDSLLPAHWNSGVPSKKSSKGSATTKRGPKPKNPETTPPGWPFDHNTWPEKIDLGWGKYAKAGRTYSSVFLDILLYEFGCRVDKESSPARIYHPKGNSYPTFRQFSNFVIGKIGKQRWKESKYGTQTIRNTSTSSANTVSEHLVNLLEEVQWDAQQLDELPGDVRDPTQPGRPLIRVVATCGTCGGPVGVGYDYGSESKWGYLMVLLCMAMRKSEFAALFGVDVSDDDWPAIGLMAGVRGDRGPSIGRPVADVVAAVLRISQEWAGSFDPVGKPVAEAGHYKTIHVEGKPQLVSKFRSPIEIIRDDIRKTVAKFRSAPMAHKLDPDQSRRIKMSTPRTLWNDLMARGLYAGQIVSYEKLLQDVVPKHCASIREDGVHLGGLRYLSDELRQSGLLERARAGAIDAEVYAINCAAKYCWIQLNGSLIRLIAVPVRINSRDITHDLTLEESFFYLERMAESRRLAEQEAQALAMYNEIEREKDSKVMAAARSSFPKHSSSGRAETTQQHRTILNKK